MLFGCCLPRWINLIFGGQTGAFPQATYQWVIFLTEFLGHPAAFASLFVLTTSQIKTPFQKRIPFDYRPTWTSLYVSGPHRASTYGRSNSILPRLCTRRLPREPCAEEIKMGAALERERPDTHELRRRLHEPKKNASRTSG